MSDTKQSYRQMRTELDDIISKLQDPETDIDTAIELHKKAKTVLKKLETYLDSVEVSVKKAINS